MSLQTSKGSCSTRSLDRAAAATLDTSNRSSSLRRAPVSASWVAAMAALAPSMKRWVFAMRRVTLRHEFTLCGAALGEIAARSPSAAGTAGATNCLLLLSLASS